VRARLARSWGLAGLAAASALDTAVVLALLTPTVDRALLAEVLVGHAVLAVAAATMLALAVAPTARRDVYALAATGFALTFFLPVGAIGLFAALRFSSLAVRSRDDEPWLRLPIDLDPTDWRPRGLQDTSAAAVAAVLADRTVEYADRRFAAVLRIAHLPRRAGVQLLKRALKDPSEEVRLFAFSRIERMRDELERALKGFRTSLDESKDDDAREHLHLRLAETFWEFVYLGLAEGAVAEHALSSALRHADESKRLGKRAAAASFLSGRILLHRLDTEAATAAFERAAHLGYPGRRVLPYLAECAFHARSFGQVRAYLRRLEELSHGHAPLPRVREFWR
jgi:polysaccharide biosynthesis protein PelE